MAKSKKKLNSLKTILILILCRILSKFWNLNYYCFLILGYNEVLNAHYNSIHVRMDNDARDKEAEVITHNLDVGTPACDKRGKFKST